MAGASQRGRVAPIVSNPDKVATSSSSFPSAQGQYALCVAPHAPLVHRCPSLPAVSSRGLGFFEGRSSSKSELSKSRSPLEPPGQEALRIAFESVELQAAGSADLPGSQDAKSKYLSGRHAQRLSSQLLPSAP